MENWEETFQTWGGKILDLYGESQKADRTYELERLRLQNLGPGGYYIEGKVGTTKNPMGIDPLYLLIGAAVVAVLVLKD